MRISSQNLSYDKSATIWHGRAWLRSKKSYDELLHVEWAFGKHARSCSLTASFGYGDTGRGICLHIGIPWIVSLYLVFPAGPRVKKEWQTGISIHNGAIWFKPMPYVMESKRDDPWYRKTYCVHFPWELDWVSTEILGHVKYGPNMPVEWREDRKHRSSLGNWEERETAASRVSREYDYAYILKNRKIQRRKATVHVERMTWRARWWPLIWRKKVSVSINVKFDQEVGEETGSWKGGCTGCGYEMKWGETPERCLSRMEHEREFRKH